MRIIETEEAARRLARAIASDLSLYNEEKILSGLKNDNLYEELSEEIEEGRELAVWTNPQFIVPKVHC